MATKENREFKFFVNNAWHQPVLSTYFDSENPSTGQVWAHVPDCNKEDVAHAVVAARSAIYDGPWGKM